MQDEVTQQQQQQKLNRNTTETKSGGHHQQSLRRHCSGMWYLIGAWQHGSVMLHSQSSFPHPVMLQFCVEFFLSVDPY
jgi:hypothetical protein